ncbi:hypothetical protein D9M71_843810 [compost metagenome]
MARQGDLHQHLAGLEQRVPVHHRAIALDQTGFLQLAHALPGGADGEVDLLGQTRLGDAPVLGEQAENLQVVAIELVHGASRGHGTPPKGGAPVSA